VLEGDPERVEALVGLGRTLEAASRDPFEVRRAYRRALAVDPQNAEALRGLAAVERLVRPTALLREQGYFDSDDLDASRLTLGTAFKLPGGASVEPYYRHLYYHQPRVIPGESPALADLNGRIASSDGASTGHGVGAEFRLEPGERLTVAGSLGFDHFDLSGTMPVVGLVAAWQLRDARLEAGFRQGPAVEELLTLASLAAGLEARSVMLSAERLLPARLRLWGQLGLAWYGEGGTEAFPGAFPANRQHRLAIRLDRPVGAVLRVGYAFRQTGFRSPSPLHFSPDLYRAHLAWVSASRRAGPWSWSLDADAGFASIDGTDSTEWTFSADVARRLGWGLELRASLREGRARTGLEAGQSYRSHGLRLGVEKAF